MTPWTKWLLKARPADYALALSVAGASLPVVGKHLEPLGGMTAMSVWGARLAPEAMSAMTKDWLTPGVSDARRKDRRSARDVSVAALRGIVSSADLDAEWPAADPNSADLGCIPPAALSVPTRRSLRGQPGTAARRLAPQGSARANPRRC